MLKQSILFLLASFIVYKYYYGVVQESPIVETINGRVRGKISISRHGKEFYEYLGIPYAKPPVGDLRYESPQESENWEGVKLTQQFGIECAQTNSMTFGRSYDEDCLTLNVFTPTIDNSAKLPVIAYIHGGLFIIGSSNMHGGNYFMDEDIILVTMNYRLASFGFLNTGDGLVSGNMGLKDQNLALKWIQNNIEQFGGDKDRVTIQGESAGGVSVSHHLLSPMSKGLFYRAISQSGTSLNSWAIQRNPEKQAKRYAEQLKCPTTNTKEMVTCLKSRPMSDILNVHKETENIFRDPITLFAPTVEVVKDGAFLQDFPYDIIRSGKVNRVPWMCGYNADEGQIFSAMLFSNASKLLEGNMDEKLAFLMHYNNGDRKHRDDIVHKTIDFYFDKNSISIIGIENFNTYTKIFTDVIFAFGITESIKLQSEYQPIYPFYYNYHGRVQLANFMFAMKGKYPKIMELLIFVAKKWITENLLGQKSEMTASSHADELILLFQTDIFGIINPGHQDYEMSKNLVKLWANFAKSERHINFLNKPLIQVDKDTQELNFLKLDMNPEIISHPNIERYNFWKKNSLLLQSNAN